MNNTETHLEKVRRELDEQRAKSPVHDFSVGDIVELTQSKVGGISFIMGKGYEVKEVDTRNCVIGLQGEKNYCLMPPEVLKIKTT